MTERETMKMHGSIWHALLVLLLLPSCRDKKPEPAPIAETASPIADAGEPDSSPGSQPTRTGPAPVPMVRFDVGKFMMGMESNAIGGDFSFLQPMHAASVPGFWLDVYEVTVKAYRTCVEAGACTADGLTPSQQQERDACNWNQPGYETDPINCVTWEQANAYCHWAGKELPTEEMWEYAAAGRKRRDFPWGEGVPMGNWGLPHNESTYIGSGCDLDFTYAHPERAYRDRHTCPVGDKPDADTPEGIKDMAANVSEWTSSFACPYKEPKCSTSERTVRGGYHDAHASMFLNVVRYGREPGFRSDNIGFRCARPDSSATPDTK